MTWAMTSDELRRQRRANDLERLRALLVQFANENPRHLPATTTIGELMRWLAREAAPPVLRARNTVP